MTAVQRLVVRHEDSIYSMRRDLSFILFLKVGISASTGRTWQRPTLAHAHDAPDLCFTRGAVWNDCSPAATWHYGGASGKLGWYLAETHSRARLGWRRRFLRWTPLNRCCLRRWASRHFRPSSSMALQIGLSPGFSQRGQLCRICPEKL